MPAPTLPTPFVPPPGATHGTLLNVFPIALHAATLDDIEHVRKAQAARFGRLTGQTPDGRPWADDKDGTKRTLNWNLDNPHVVILTAIINAMANMEAQAVKNLELAIKGQKGSATKREIHGHLLAPWIQSQRGLGFKQVGRLLAATGDPYWRPTLTYDNPDDPENPKVIPEGPRTVSALWAYCGLHVLKMSAKDAAQAVQQDADDLWAGEADRAVDVAQDGLIGVAARRRRGVRANWSTEAKTRAYLCATSCLKQLTAECAPKKVKHKDGEGVQHQEGCACSPFRVAYDKRRAHTTANRPQWTDGHRHNDAIRYSSKEILKALWVASRDLHWQFDPTLPERFGATEWTGATEDVTKIGARTTGGRTAPA